MGLLLRAFAGLWRAFLGGWRDTPLAPDNLCYLRASVPLSFTGGWAGPGRSGRMQRLLGKAQLTTVFLVWPNICLSCAGCLRAESGQGGHNRRPSQEGIEGMLFLMVGNPLQHTKHS